MNQRRWYEDGLRFQCTGCGECCTGEPGFVWVNKAEIEGLAEAVGLEVPRFEKKYVRAIGVRKSLLEMSGGDCVFFDGRTRRCRVYQVRPRQCRTWPFWPSNVRTPSDWARTCEVCPGSGQGPLVPPEEIESRVAVLRV